MITLAPQRAIVPEPRDEGQRHAVGSCADRCTSDKACMARQGTLTEQNSEPRSMCEP